MKVRTKVLLIISVVAALVLCSSAAVLAAAPDKGVGTLYIKSANPAEQGRAWVESSKDKSNKAKGSMKLVDSRGYTIYEGELTQIKGRGNSTWLGAKKPYQIKTAEKVDLLATGNDENKSKTWVLLANYYDHSHMRNILAFDLASAMGMENPVEHVEVNLYYDGEYRGVYQLCEKVMVGKGRVDINDLEAENEEANPDLDLAGLEVKTGFTANGATYHYCFGMLTPSDFSGGYLLEMDYAERAAEEVSYFTTSRGNNIVVKSPECCSRAEMDYIATYYQDFENALYSGGKDPATGKKITDFVDMETVAQCYIIHELSKNNDGFISSSYLYKDKGEGVMKMGPVWDYDSTFGLAMNYDRERTGNPKGLYTATYGVGEQLFRIPEFRVAVKNMYAKTVYPLIRTIYLGSYSAASADGALRSFDYYKNVLTNASYTDANLWGYTDFDESCLTVKNFVQQRSEWLLTEFNRWSESGIIYFTDVQPNAWYFNTVGTAYEKGLMNGVGDNEFSPNATMTRAQVAQVLYNIGGTEAVAANVADFSDLGMAHWAYKAVKWAVSKGIVTGYSNGTFKPGSPISRQDFVTMLYRSAGSPAVTGSTLGRYPDAGSVAGYAKNAVQWALDNGLISGYGDGTLRPASGATRAEAATILLRYHK